VLSADRPRRRRPPRSLRAEYEEFITQRIEEYKDTLPRAEILSIGDEALLELARAEQFQLTELLLAEQVDQIIRRRLRLPSYRRWRERHLALRTAQAEPGHWGLASRDPVVVIADLVEDQDPVLVVGSCDGACALFLAARGAQVTVADPDIAAVEGLENRAIAEALGSRIECVVVPLGAYLPPNGEFAACVVETSAVADLSPSERATLFTRLKQATLPLGRHAVMPSAARDGASPPLSSDALRTLYSDWSVARAPLGSGSAAGRRPRNVGFVAVKPEPSQTATQLAVSE
jgi:hypothetical protein